MVQRSEKRTPNELNVSMERNQLEKSVRLQELNTLYAAFDKEINDLQATRRKVLEHEPELARLEQVLSVAEKSRGLYLDSLEKARIDQALDDRPRHDRPRTERGQQGANDPGRATGGPSHHKQPAGLHSGEDVRAGVPAEPSGVGE